MKKHQDYNVAIDPEERELRPRTVDKAAELVLSVRSTSEQAAAGFQQTGKLVTLPYENEILRPQNIILPFIWYS